MACAADSSSDLEETRFSQILHGSRQASYHHASTAQGLGPEGPALASGMARARCAWVRVRGRTFALVEEPGSCALLERTKVGERSWVERRSAGC